MRFLNEIKHQRILSNQEEREPNLSEKNLHRKSNSYSNVGVSLEMKKLKLKVSSLNFRYLPKNKPTASFEKPLLHEVKEENLESNFTRETEPNQQANGIPRGNCQNFQFIVNISQNQQAQDGDIETCVRRHWVLPKEEEQKVRVKAENPVTPKKSVCVPKATLRGHLDSIHCLSFSERNNLLVTAGEDFLLRVWNTQNFSGNNAHFEPLTAFHGHTGAVLAMEVSNHFQEPMIVSAGVEGSICFSSLDPENVGQNNNWGNVHAVPAHDECVWNLACFPLEPLLLSSSADGLIKVWRIEDENNFGLKTNSATCISALTLTNQNQLIPTSNTWIPTYPSIISAYQNFKELVLFDIEREIALASYPFESKATQFECNKMVINEEFLISAHEDKSIRFFDLRTPKNVKTIIGHSDSVTSLAFLPAKQQFASVGHDGSLRIWDCRAFKCVYELPVHKKKYDEACNCIGVDSRKNLLATGGADGLLNIFSCPN